ncbi:MAG: diacylglycerol kinase family lipid kinase [Pseudonocardiaceae bacterium]|nr:diacylglycerol kinase family lipid kinase [Pseudonocardiaceae bacterium]
MRAVLLVNPHATATTPAGRDVLTHALASELKLDVVATRYRGHATHIAQQAREEGYELVIAHGGDGTVNEAINGLLAHGPAAAPALGVVPGGLANVFARALGLDRDPVEATHRLLIALEAGRSRRVGLGRIDGPALHADRAAGTWFGFNAGLGWDADVVARVERHRARGREASPARYVRSALRAHLRLMRSAPRLTAALPRGRTEQGLRSAVVSNTDPWTYLGNRPVHTNPNASFDTGLGFFALRSMAPATVLRHIGQMLRTHADPAGRNLIRLDDVDSVRVHCDRPVDLQVDGDHFGHRTAVEFTSVPDALCVVL